MKSRSITFTAILFGLIVATWPAPCMAHHPIGTSTASAGCFAPASSRTRPPDSFADLTFSYDHLDQDLGYVMVYQLAAEWQVVERLSLGARLPFLSIRENLLTHTDNFGDVAISAKWLAWQTRDESFNLALGSEISAPTGSESKGTGSGEWIVSPYLSIAKNFNALAIAASLGSSIELASTLRPSIDYSLALIFPIVKSKTPVSALLTFQASTLTQSDALQSGSTKGYIKPALAVNLTPKLITTIGAKVSVIDTLKVKSGTSLSQQSTVPLSDVQFGFFLNLNQSF